MALSVVLESMRQGTQSDTDKHTHIQPHKHSIGAGVLSTGTYTSQKNNNREVLILKDFKDSHCSLFHCTLSCFSGLLYVKMSYIINKGLAVHKD